MYLERILNFIGCRCINAASKFDCLHNYPTDEYNRYMIDDPGEMMRVRYNLSEESMVVDVGGLTGDWASRIYCLYSCNIDVYEPHPVLSQQAILNFETNRKVNIYQYGLGDTTTTLNLYGDSHGASLYKNNTGKITRVPVFKSSEIFKKYNHIDLLKLNVEGAEYSILPDLISNYDMRRIHTIQIQFHMNVVGYNEKREEIRRALGNTHHMTWNYNYIFENWVINGDTHLPLHKT